RVSRDADACLGLYASPAEWAHGGNPYTIVLNETPNLNHPVLLPLLWLFTLVSLSNGFVVWSVCSLALFAGCVPAIARAARLAPVDVVAAVLAATGTFLALAFG